MANSDEKYMDSAQRSIAEEFFSEEMVNGTLISPHSAFLSEYDLVQLPDGRYLAKEKKIEIINKDLTSGFLTPEMQVFNFCTADYLSKIVDLEKDIKTDLTRHYNKTARLATYTYSLSKSGGQSANIVKSHFTESKSYQVQHLREEENKKRGNAVKNFLSALPKPNVRPV